MQSEIKLPPVESIRDSLEPIALPPHGDFYNAAILIGIALAMVLLLAFGWIVRRRRPAFGGPMGRATMRLSLINPEAREAFHQLHAIVADFLTARFRFPATTKTSSEIVASLRETGFVDLSDIEAFLLHADRGRFSTHRDADARAAIEQCGRILERLDTAMKGKPGDAPV